MQVSPNERERPTATGFLAHAGWTWDHCRRESNLVRGVPASANLTHFQIGTRLPSVYSNNDQSAWIISQRPPKAAVSAFEPNGFFLECERSRSGHVVTSGTILLANKECPWRCLMCDLWKHTLP